MNCTLFFETMMKIFYLFLLVIIQLPVSAIEVNGQEKLVIAHRGASGYLPEHSMPAKAMAYAMGADYIEQDVVMTKDDELIVLHDLYLDRVTDVAAKFPNRKRADGRYYVIDFTLAEVQSLAMTEGFNDKNGQAQALYPERFPIWQSSFRVHTLADEIELIQGLNKSTGKNVGLYPEIKSPAFHRHHKKDISKAILTQLKQYGYDSKTSKVFLQSFDPIELKRIHNRLLPSLNMELKLVQLIAETSWQETLVYQNGKSQPYDYDWMLKAGAMEKIAKYADGIGLWKPMLIDTSNATDTSKVKANGVLAAAHQAGLLVHPYTFRADKGRIPNYVNDFSELLRFYYFDIGVDGVFTDFPDKAVDVLKQVADKP